MRRWYARGVTRDKQAEKRDITSFPRENPRFSCRGTRSSNPSPSSGESANFRFLSRPLRGPPIAVAGGVVLAASYEAKAFGVRSGMPGRRACELCPERTFVSGHFEDYQRLGDAAIKVLGDYTPLVERISIDEAFAMSRIDA